MALHSENSYAKHLAQRVKNGELVEINEFILEFKWLSNFYWHYGMPYTVEHLFQSAKAAGDDTVFANKILHAKTPGIAKRMGRKARLPAHWDIHRLVVMKKALELKFGKSPLKDWLLATGEIPLSEGNYWHDQYWGDCHCAKCHSTPGNNNLGILLMEVRSELRALLDADTSHQSFKELAGKRLKE